jgi:hypothetical protein
MSLRGCPFLIITDLATFKEVEYLSKITNKVSSLRALRLYKANSITHIRRKEERLFLGQRVHGF